MSKSAAILLALALGATGCDSPTEFVDPVKPGLPLSLSLYSDDPGSISLTILESNYRPYLGFRIPGSARLVEGELVVVLENRIESPTCPCLMAGGPAGFWDTFQLDPGIYDLSISFDGLSDRYQIIIEEDSYRLSGPQGDFSGYERTAAPTG